MSGCFDTREERAVAAGLRGEPPDSDLDWRRVLTLSRLHLIDALLHDAWERQADHIPPAVLATLAGERRTNALRGAAGILQRDAVLTALRARGVPALVLKGAGMAAAWYGDLGLRPFQDIDLLVPPEQLGRGRQALLAIGYTPAGTTLPDEHHHTMPLRHAHLPCAVELHHRPTYFPSDGWPPFAILLDRSITVPDGGGGSVPTLGPEDTLLQICLHLLADTWSRGGWRLRQLADLARHVRTFAIDWTVVTVLARDAGMLSSCRAVLSLASVVLGVSVPAGMVDREGGALLLRHPMRPGATDPVPYRRLYQQAARLSLSLRQAESGELPGATPVRRRLLAHDLRRLWDLVGQCLMNPRTTVEQIRHGIAAERDLAHTRADVRALLMDTDRRRG